MSEVTNLISTITQEQIKSVQLHGAQQNRQGLERMTPINLQVTEINEDDMGKFAYDVNNAFFECSDSYDLLEKVDGEWVWNEYLIEGDKTTLEFTTPISSFDRDGVTYYDIQIGHTWEVEEGA